MVTQLKCISVAWRRDDTEKNTLSDEYVKKQALSASVTAQCVYKGAHAGTDHFCERGLPFRPTMLFSRRNNWIPTGAPNSWSAFVHERDVLRPAAQGQIGGRERTADAVASRDHAMRRLWTTEQRFHQQFRANFCNVDMRWIERHVLQVCAEVQLHSLQPPLTATTTVCKRRPRRRAIARATQFPTLADEAVTVRLEGGERKSYRVVSARGVF